MPEEKLGEVIHFFQKPMVAAIKLSATLKVGDKIHINGITTDITMDVTSMQIDRNAVESADAGADVGIQVSERARQGDAVLKITD